MDVTIQAIVDQLMNKDNADEILRYAIQRYADVHSCHTKQPKSL